MSGLLFALLLHAPPVLPEAPVPVPVPVPVPAQDVANPSAEPEPEPEPEPALPALESEPPVPDPPDPLDPGPPQPQPQPQLAPLVAVVQAPPEGYVKVRRPRHSGLGMFVASGASFVTAGFVQAIDSIVVGDVGFGVAERVLLASSMGLAAGGAKVRAHADAFDDAAFGRKSLPARKVLIAGAVLLGTGAVLGLVNEGFWWRCVFDDTGPYDLPEDPDSFSPVSCRSGLTRGLLDISSGAVAAGLGMVTWSLAYRRDAKAYERARVLTARPTFGPGRAGFTLEGRF